MRNPINNAIVLVPESKLTTCNRCGCPDLAWVQFKSGKYGLVNTTYTRPLYRGDYSAPEAPPGYRYAVKFAFHNCEQYRKDRQKFANNGMLAQIKFRKHELACTLRQVTMLVINKKYDPETVTNANKYCEFAAKWGPSLDTMEQRLDNGEVVTEQEVAQLLNDSNVENISGGIQ